MFKFLSIILTVPAMLLAVDGTNVSYPVITPIEQASEAAKSNNNFCISLQQNLNQENENIFFSPFSIHSCLSLVYIGANGQTRDELQKGLCIPYDQTCSIFFLSELQQQMKDLETNKVSFNLANAVWHDESQPLLPAYTKMLNEFFSAGLQKAAFTKNPTKEKDRINEWIAQQTHNEIQNLLSDTDISSSTRVVLVNALYLKGEWKEHFHLSGKAPFHLEDGSENDVEMMSLTKAYQYSENNQFKSAFIPLNHPSLGCIVMLPNEGKEIGDIEKELTHEMITNVLTDFSNERLDLKLPKFSLSCKVNLKKTLNNLGVYQPFSFGADFSLMAPGNSLALDQVIHQAKIDFDEKGITAAAATAAVMNCKSCFNPHEKPPISFHVNKPFLFAIVDKKSQAILFWGRVKNPTSTTM